MPEETNTMTEDNLADEIMCECTGTTRGKIFNLVSQRLDFDAISSKTGVNTGCGGCEWEIESFIEALKEGETS
ncbi:MAG: (2Fe-2S)-binding protein [Methylophilaceae bacterium]